MVTIDTGTSYAMAPLVDILAIVKALKRYYRIDCYPDNQQQDVHYQFAWFVCDIGSHDFNSLPNIQLTFNQTSVAPGQNKTIQSKNFDLTTNAFLEPESEERSIKLMRKTMPLQKEVDPQGQ